MLRELGHRVVVEQSYDGGSGDLLVALHARRSAPSVERFGAEHPKAPIVLALTGTDVYGDIRVCAAAQKALEQASCFVVLQRLAVDELPEPFRSRCHVIYQSAVCPPGDHRPRPNVFDVAVLGHLRQVKDPFRAAAAARLLDGTSPVRILHAGAAPDDEMAAEARAEAGSNPRYRWLGDLPRWKALRLLARSRLLALTSVAEGGANVVSEALACSVPVVSSGIPGSVGILGADYQGYFPVGDTEALASLLERAAGDARFYDKLREACRGLRMLVDPIQERRSWRDLLRSL